jgi:hypothetical protein
MIFLFFTDQTQRGLTRQRQKLVVTMDDQLFTTPEPPRRSGGLVLPSSSGLILESASAEDMAVSGTVPS